MTNSPDPFRRPAYRARLTPFFRHALFVLYMSVFAIIATVTVMFHGSSNPHAGELPMAATTCVLSPTQSIVRFHNGSCAGLTGGVDGRLVVIEAADSYVTLLHEDGRADAADRFHTPGGVPWTVGPGQGLTLRYDGLEKNWKPVIATRDSSCSPGSFVSAVTEEGKATCVPAAPTLHGCGTGAVLLSGASDFSGTVQAGSLHIDDTCTIVFATAFDRVQCLVEPVPSTAGATFTTRDAVTTHDLTVWNVTAGESFRYLCVAGP